MMDEAKGEDGWDERTPVSVGTRLEFGIKSKKNIEDEGL